MSSSFFDREDRTTYLVEAVRTFYCRPLPLDDIRSWCAKNPELADAGDESGDTPLILAIESHSVDGESLRVNIDLCRVLIECKASVHGRRNLDSNRTALEIAVQQRQCEVDLIRFCGPQVRAKSSQSSTCYTYAELAQLTTGRLSDWGTHAAF